jgi:hypothetical protein
MRQVKSHEKELFGIAGRAVSTLFRLAFITFRFSLQDREGDKQIKTP